MQKGWEPWSSGYEMRLMYWRGSVRISASHSGWTFFTYICCKIVMFVRNDEIKTKKSLGIAHFLKTNEKKILPVSGSGIQTHNLSNTSLLQQPLDHCSHPFFIYAYVSIFSFFVSNFFWLWFSYFRFSFQRIRHHGRGGGAEWRKRGDSKFKKLATNYVASILEAIV